MAKTKVVVSKNPSAPAPQQVPAAGTTTASIDFFANDEFHWKNYAQLLAKELHNERHSKTLKPKKKIDKPPTAKQIASRQNFKDRVEEARVIRRESAKKMSWKESMAESYRRAKELNAEVEALAKEVVL